MHRMDTRQAQHLVQVQCLRPFLQPARYAVEFLGGNLGEIFVQTLVVSQHKLNQNESDIATDIL